MNQRLGEILLGQGVLNQDQLAHALATQLEIERRGEMKLLGNLLVELKLASAEQVDNALVKQWYLHRAAAIREADETGNSMPHYQGSWRYF